MSKNKLIFDFSKLRGRIVEKFGTIENFSNALGMSRVAMSNRLNNKIYFSLDEMYAIAKILDIEDISAYFFTLKV